MVTANELSGTVAIFLVNTAPVVTFLDDVIRYEEGEGDVEIRVAVEKAGPAGTATLQVLDASTARS
ncbi:MAG: hypothetical protein IPG32_16725 [Saprospirales bacterium]|nr:hypothetical protein [Saprospirales bacterium]